MVEFDILATKFLDLPLCGHSIASSEYSGQNQKLITTLQSLTSKYMGLQGNPCNENRDPVMRSGVPCNENRCFPVKKTYREFPESLSGFGFAVK